MAIPIRQLAQYAAKHTASRSAKNMQRFNVMPRMYMVSQKRIILKSVTVTRVYADRERLSIYQPVQFFVRFKPVAVVF